MKPITAPKIGDWLTQKLLSRTVLLFAAGMTLITVADIGFIFFEQKQQLLNQCATFGRQASRQLDMGDYWRVQEDLRSFFYSSALSSASIWDRHGMQVARFGEKEPAPYTARRQEMGLGFRHTPEGWKILYQSPIANANGENVGSWSALFTPDKEIQLALLRLCGSFLIFAGILVIAYRTIRKAIFKTSTPLKEVAETVAKAQHLKDLHSIEPTHDFFETDILLENIRRLSGRLLLAEKEKEATLQLAAKGKIAVQVAHDIRSPLATLQAIAEKMEETELTRLLLLSTKRLAGIADDLLKKYKQAAPSSSSFLLSKIFEELIQEYTAQKTDKKISFIKEFSSQEIRIQGEPYKLQRVFSNLIKNATDAIAAQGTLTLKTEYRDNTAVISVQDDGCGMSPEILQQVRKGAHRSTKSEGYGIGLQYVEEALRELGGSMEIESEPGQGSLFRITLPLTEKSRVVVIDDDAMLLSTWKLSKQRLKIDDLHCFRSLEEAMSAGLPWNQVHFAFVDKNIDGSLYNAPQTLDWLKKQGVKTLILATGDDTAPLKKDPNYSQVDHFAHSKIPESLYFFS